MGFVTDRAERGLAIEANRLLGGDAVVRGDQPIAGLLREAASAPGLAHTGTVEFSSMIRAGEGGDAALRLGDLRALGDEIGRASGREGGCPYVSNWVAAVSIKKK